MKRPKAVHINHWLLPLSWLYGFIVSIRNKFFDWGILPQEEYDVPVICVGNITIGGTGKTPHIEYLVELLKDDYKIAVLSRGYKRKTSGFVLAEDGATATQIGDEPFQIKNKYPDIMVAVDANRRQGINLLLSLPLEKRPDLILLDDAFQHRYVKPSLTILLTNFNRLMCYDALLPAGRLREPVHNMRRANIVIVTKCPTQLNRLEQRIIAKNIHAYPYQYLSYTFFSYGMITPLSGNSDQTLLHLNQIKGYDALLVTGIADPTPLRDTINKYAKNIVELNYPDHHLFSEKDILNIEAAFEGLSGKDKIILVTEKDAARLNTSGLLPDEFKKNFYYVPIRVSFINKEDKENFNHKIKKHVRKNT
jgi:tetraacyldisaccharide 4'-kinase